MRRPEFIARQSRCPGGLLGRLIGRIMVSETVAENDATIACLELRPGDRVLEIGFGPGRALERAASAVGPQGKVFGIDTSEEMLRVAERRCGAFVRQGVVDVRLGTVERMPFPDGAIDKALSVHTLYFWPDPLTAMAELRRVLRAGGHLALCFRKSSPEARAAFPASVYRFYGVDEVLDLLRAAGFAELTMNAVGRDASLAIVSARTLP